jgi:hypothetical protein
MSAELIQFEMHQLESFYAAIGAIGSGERNVGFNLGQSDIYSLGKQPDVFVGTFNAVEGRLGAVAHVDLGPLAEDRIRYSHTGL